MAKHGARRKEHRLNRPEGAVNACGLVAFASRREANFGATRMPLHPDMPARPYLCINGCQLWHVGYLPELVVQGVVTADEWYGRNGHKPMRSIIPPLLEQITRTTRFGTPTISRRTCMVTDRDLWTMIVDTPDAGQLAARDYDSPAEATAVVLNEYRAVIAGTAQPAALVAA
jgi:hypothetical protein